MYTQEPRIPLDLIEFGNCPTHQIQSFDWNHDEPYGRIDALVLPLKFNSIRSSDLNSRDISSWMI